MEELIPTSVLTRVCTILARDDVADAVCVACSTCGAWRRLCLEPDADRNLWRPVYDAAEVATDGWPSTERQYPAGDATCTWREKCFILAKYGRRAALVVARHAVFDHERARLCRVNPALWPIVSLPPPPPEQLNLPPPPPPKEDPTGLTSLSITASESEGSIAPTATTSASSTSSTSASVSALQQVDLTVPPRDAPAPVCLTATAFGSPSSSLEPVVQQTTTNGECSTPHDGVEQKQCVSTPNMENLNKPNEETQQVCPPAPKLQETNVESQSLSTTSESGSKEKVTSPEPTEVKEPVVATPVSSETSPEPTTQTTVSTSSTVTPPSTPVCPGTPCSKPSMFSLSPTPPLLSPTPPPPRRTLFSQPSSPLTSISASLLPPSSSLPPPPPVCKVPPLPSAKEFLVLIRNAKQILQKEPNVMRIQLPVIVVGDTHGHIEDIYEIFNLAGTPPNTKYLFLGDYVDRGLFSLEALAVLLSYKILYPESVTLLRGNHESRTLTQFYGFLEDCKNKFSEAMWLEACNLFDCFPLAAIIDNKILAVHAGLSPSLHSISDLEAVDRFGDVGTPGVVTDLTWSDPDDSNRPQQMWTASVRGAGFIFGSNITAQFLEANNLHLLIRSHQLATEGINWLHGNKCCTVFSASNYCYTCNNKGGALMLQHSDGTGGSFPLRWQKRLCGGVDGIGGNICGEKEGMSAVANGTPPALALCQQYVERIIAGESIKLTEIVWFEPPRFARRAPMF